MLFKFQTRPQTDFHPQASLNCGILSRSGIYPLGYAPCTPPHKYLPFTPILHHFPHLPDIQTSFSQTIHLFLSLPTERLPAHSPSQTLLAILSFSIFSTWPNNQRTPSSILSPTHFYTLHNSLIREFWTISILLIPSKPLRLPICPALIVDLSFSIHSIVSLPYIRTGISNVSCKTQAHSICKSLTLTRDLMAPATFLPLTTFLLHSAPSVLIFVQNTSQIFEF